jgi:hypothetical protein
MHLSSPPYVLKHFLQNNTHLLKLAHEHLAEK